MVNGARPTGAGVAVASCQPKLLSPADILAGRYLPVATSTTPVAAPVTTSVAAPSCEPSSLAPALPDFDPRPFFAASVPSAPGGATTVLSSSSPARIAPCDSNSLSLPPPDHSASWDTSGDSDATPLHKAAKGTKLDAFAALLQQNPSAIHAMDDKGKTPLHLAAAAGREHITHALLSAGADLSALDHRGLTPLYGALEAGAYGTAASLLRTMERHRGAEPLAARTVVWQEPAAVQALLDTEAAALRAGNGKAKGVDELVHVLTGAPITDAATSDTQEALNNEENVTKLRGHAGRWTGMKGGIRNTGWWTERFLPQRVRTLVRLYLASDAELQPQATALPGVADVASLRRILLAELTNSLETLRLARRVTAVRMMAHSGRVPQAKAFGHQLMSQEINALLQRLAQGEPGSEQILPLGYPGHALYGSLCLSTVEGQQVLVLRIDNLGAGINIGHNRDDDDLVPSFIRNIPLSYYTSPAGRQVVHDLLTNILLIKSTPGLHADAVYGALFEFSDTLDALATGAAFARNRTSVPHDVRLEAQLVGNCVYENHTASLAQRRGYAFMDWLTRRETEFARELLVAQNSESADAARQRKHDIQHLRTKITRKKGDRTARLTTFLSRRSDRNLPSGLTHADVLPIITDGDAGSMQLLLSHGLVANRKDDETGDTLLHTATRYGRGLMVQALLSHDANPLLTNKAGELPLGLHNKQVQEEKAALLSLKQATQTALAKAAKTKAAKTKAAKTKAAKAKAAKVKAAKAKTKAARPARATKAAKTTRPAAAPKSHPSPQSSASRAHGATAHASYSAAILAT